MGRGGYYALFARSNEPCMAGMAGGQRELALIWPHDRPDIYGECRGSEQTKSASLPTRQTLYMAGMAGEPAGTAVTVVSNN